MTKLLSFVVQWPLLLLKPKVLELERAAVLADGAHRALLKAVGLLGLDLHHDLHLSADLAGQALDHLGDDERHVLVAALGVDGHPPVIAPEPS